ncbi:NAD(P)/FAD-dependent oxidoreductase [Gryllotalpicola ginsengisoli]|uniref:NAD(P)/FAD-dependent oxidoreductase n=1 Tax=Gryllotalpicola ginsengisoli TaxID=444608 RepID=UPI0003B5F425|nr:FAD-dependent oxidoreductase [Gryllotalpicola ginsengisoli]
MHSDAIVIGAGAVGAACARALAGAGLTVTVLDASGAAAGTSGQGEGNLLVSDKLRGPELSLAMRSLELWDGLQRELDDELPPGIPPLEYERKGGLVVATTDDGAAPLLDFAAQQRAAGIDARPLTAAEALDLEPDLNPAVTAAVFYPEDAQVQPVNATEALLASARARGARTVFGARVIAALPAASDRLTGVRTTRGDFTADHVILAAGPWSGEVAACLGASLPVRPRRGVVLVTTRMPHRIFHKVYDADYVAAVESDAASLQTSSVIESTAGGTVLVGSSRQQRGFDDALDLTAVREIAEKATRVFPFLAGASVMRVYGGFRPFLPDHLPVIGPDPAVAGLWHATGHEGAGIGLALGTAELLRDLVTGRAPQLEPGAFAPSRGTLAAA